MNKELSKFQLIEELKKLESLSDQDPEQAHVDAVRLLLQFINDLEIEDAFIRIHRWYS